MRLRLFQDSTIITSIEIDDRCIGVIRSEPGSDDYLRIDRIHRVSVANLFAEMLRQRSARESNKFAAGRFPSVNAQTDSDVSDEEILNTAYQAFSSFEKDPYDEIQRLLRENGIPATYSLWSNR
ncbi:hypothetical protein PUV54_14340 [Hyphococcus flavus]|uniref:Uncharacterized protein n=1 Tax=Hyphococcus flavus TaxID=1866326 RepID=A0AAE9ZHU2_9PROT|nr:hypothetical protein [Hyphococcus flavus]WDI31131.1 hypothetical protein PUV54_14340 [Hyphococcus flavus]